MTILICIPCLLTGGTEIQTLSLVHALVKSGHKVITVCYFEHNRNIVFEYEKSGATVVCLSPDGIRYFGKSAVVFLYKGLRKVKKEFNPDAAHVQYMAPGAIPIILLKILGVRTILATTHTTADIYSSLKLVRFIQKYLVKAFTCVTLKAEKSFFGSAHLYTETTELKRRNHFTIYNALPAYIQIKDNRKDFQETITLGVVSRLEKIKGMDLLVPSFSRIRKLHPDIEFIVVGDGSLSDSMKQQAKEFEIEDNITWYGRQTQDKLQSIYDQIDILLMPSRSEAFGLTALEAMARGCVVVASDVGGLPEIVIDKQVGLLHLSESIDDIIEKVNTLLHNRDLLELYSVNAIKHAKQYGFEKYALLFNNLYSKLKQ